MEHGQIIPSRTPHPTPKKATYQSHLQSSSHIDPFYTYACFQRRLLLPRSNGKKRRKLETWGLDVLLYKMADSDHIEIVIRR